MTESLSAYAIRKEGDLVFECCVREDGRPGRFWLRTVGPGKGMRTKERRLCWACVGKLWDTD